MQALASRLWSPDARHHPGQLAWSAAYGEPEALDLGPVFVPDDAWAWLESPGWLEVCGTDPEAVRAVVDAALAERGGEVSASTLETEDVVLGRAGRRRVHRGRVAVVHPPPPRPGRPAGRWPPRGVRRPRGAGRASTSRGRGPPRRLVADVEGDRAAYARLMATPPYRPATDHVVAHHRRHVGAPRAACGSTRRPGRAGRAGRVRGGARRARPGDRRLGLGAHRRPRRGRHHRAGCPRGDDDYPAPGRLYRGSASCRGRARGLTGDQAERSEACGTSARDLPRQPDRQGDDGPRHPPKKRSRQDARTNTRATLSLLAARRVGHRIVPRIPRARRTPPRGCARTPPRGRAPRRGWSRTRESDSE